MKNFNKMDKSQNKVAQQPSNVPDNSGKSLSSSTKLPQDKNKKPLNPVKPRGKNSEAEKKSLKQSNLKQTQNSKKNGQNKGKSAKVVKKEPEKELFLHFGKKVININGEEQDLDDNTFLRYKVIGILFTGSWVPPAKEFMEKLEKLYEEVNANEKVFEIVQIPNEKSEQAFKEQLTEKRNWLYLPFNDPFIKTLVEQYKVEYLPTFIIVNREMFVLSTNGRKDMLENEGKTAYEKWYKLYRERKEALEAEREKKELEMNNKDDV